MNDASHAKSETTHNGKSLDTTIESANDTRKQTQSKQ